MSREIIRFFSNRVSFFLAQVYLFFLLSIFPFLNCLEHNLFLKRMILVLGTILTFLVFSFRRVSFLLPFTLSLIWTLLGVIAYLFSLEDRPFLLGMFNLISQVGLVSLMITQGSKIRSFLLFIFLSYSIIIFTSWIQGFHPQFTILSFSQNAIWVHHFIIYLLIYIVDFISKHRKTTMEHLVLTLLVVFTGFYSSGRMNILISLLLLIPVLGNLLQQKKMQLLFFTLALLGGSLYLPSNMDGARFTCKNKCPHQAVLLFGFVGIEPYKGALEDLKREYAGFTEEDASIGDFYYFEQKSLSSPRFLIWKHYIQNLNVNTFLWGDNTSLPEILKKRKNPYKAFAINPHNVLIQTHKISGIIGLMLFIVVCLLVSLKLWSLDRRIGFLFLLLIMRANTDTFLMYSTYTYVFFLFVTIALQEDFFKFFRNNKFLQKKLVLPLIS